MPYLEPQELQSAMVLNDGRQFQRIYGAGDGAFSLAGDGGVTDATNQQQVASGFSAAEASGHGIFVPEGTYKLDHTLLPNQGLVLDGAGQSLRGFNKGRSVIEIQKPWVPGHIVSIANDHGDVRDLQFDLSTNMPNDATCNGAVTYTTGTGIPTTITVTSGTFGRVIQPGVDGAPATCWATIGSDETNGLPQLTFSYTGVNSGSNQLTGCLVDGFCGDIFEAAATTLSKPTGTVLFTWSSSARVRPRPAWGSLIRITAKRDTSGGITTSGSTTLPGRKVCRLVSATLKNDGSSFTVTVDDTTGLLSQGGSAFAASGKLMVDGYRVSYTGKTATTFTTCTWDSENRTGSDKVVSAGKSVCQVVNVTVSGTGSLTAPTAGNASSSSAGAAFLGTTHVFYDELVTSSGVTTLRGCWGGEYDGQVIASGTTCYVADNAQGCRVRDVYGSGGCDTVFIENAWNLAVQGVLNSSANRYGIRLADNPAHPDLQESNWIANRFQGQNLQAGYYWGIAGGHRTTGCKSNQGVIGWLARGWTSLGRGGTVNLFCANSGFESGSVHGMYMGGGCETQSHISVDNTKVQGEKGTVAGIVMDRFAHRVVIGEGVTSNIQSGSDAQGYRQYAGIAMHVKDGTGHKLGGYHNQWQTGVRIDSATIASNMHLEWGKPVFEEVPVRILDTSASTDIVDHDQRFCVPFSSLAATAEGGFSVTYTNNRAGTIELEIFGVANGTDVARNIKYIIKKAGSAQPALGATIFDQDIGTQALGASLSVDLATRTAADGATDASNGWKFTSATASFVRGDLSKQIAITISGVTYTCTIIGVVSGTEIRLDTQLATSQSGLTWVINASALTVKLVNPAASTFSGRCNVKLGGYARRVSVNTKGGSDRFSAPA